MSEHPRLGLSELHLAAEAIAAYLDGELAPVPRQRAAQHLLTCIECADVLSVQRQAKRTLWLASAPAPDQGLLAKLRSIPIDTDLPGTGDPELTLAMDGDQLVWCRQEVFPTALPAPEPTPTEPKPSEPTAMEREHQPRFGTLSRGLFGAAAAVLVGMLAATTPAASGGTGAQSPVSPATSDRPAETTDVVTASVPHVFGDAPLLLDPRPAVTVLSGPHP